jgi:hypothetical protein
MNKMKVSLTILSYFLFQSIYCQEVGTSYKTLKDFTSELHFGNARSVHYSIDGSTTEVEGSVYLDEHFVNGDIITEQSEHFAEIPMRYNAYMESIEIKLSDGIIYSLKDPSKIQQILLKSRILVYTDFGSADKKRSGYLFVLYQGKSSLYVRIAKAFKEGIPSNGITPETPPKIIDKPKEYYIKLKDELPRYFSSKKELLELLKSHESEIEGFMKTEKVKTNNEDDLIKVLTYYDSR